MTGIAVAWGIFMLIVLVGMSNGVVNSFEEGIASQSMNIIKLWGGQTSAPYHGYRQGRYIALNYGDMARIQKDSPDRVESLSAELNSPAVTVSTPKDYLTTNFKGVYPCSGKEQRLKMQVGRFINDMDLRDRRKVAVVPSLVAGQLFADPCQAVGQTLRMGNVTFKVVGVFESEWQNVVYVPFTTAKTLLSRGQNVDEISVNLKNVHSVADGTEAEQAVRQSLGAVHDFDPYDQAAVYAWNQFNDQMQMAQGMNILQITVWVIGLFTLISGIIGVSNIMFVSVRERTHEIGIRRAIGAKPRTILRQIILESITITTFFGYIGIVLGTAVCEVIARVIPPGNGFSNPRTSLGVALGVTAVLILSGLGAGLFPALKALKIKPVEALREE